VDEGSRRVPPEDGIMAGDEAMPSSLGGFDEPINRGDDDTLLSRWGDDPSPIGELGVDMAGGFAQQKQKCGKLR
jgi:hypothetical protein